MMIFTVDAVGNRVALDPLDVMYMGEVLEDKKCVVLLRNGFSFALPDLDRAILDNVIQSRAWGDDALGLRR